MRRKSLRINKIKLNTMTTGGWHLGNLEIKVTGATKAIQAILSSAK